MPAQPWASDFDKLKRDLTQRLDRLDTATQQTARSSSGGDPTRKIQELERMVTELERKIADFDRRLVSDIQAINRTFTSAHTSDQRITGRLDAVERRVQTTIDETNRTFTSAHSADERFTTRLDALDRRLTTAERTASRR